VHGKGRPEGRPFLCRGSDRLAGRRGSAAEVAVLERLRLGYAKEQERLEFLGG